MYGALAELLIHVGIMTRCPTAIYSASSSPLQLSIADEAQKIRTAVDFSNKLESELLSFSLCVFSLYLKFEVTVFERICFVGSGVLLSVFRFFVAVDWR